MTDPQKKHCQQSDTAYFCALITKPLIIASASSQENPQKPPKPPCKFHASTPSPSYYQQLHHLRHQQLE